ncbi:MAG: DegV family EDD domain-containing protein [Actinobacteria bacterium]|nr:DegV family EDD domain-containing protein [Actinomycetota bacterium]
MSRQFKIGLCTDSSAQLPRQLVDRFDVAVVPLTVSVGECEYLDGVDLDVDEFYRMLGSDDPPHVVVSQPSPGQFAVAYDELTARGCTDILSIHASAAVSGALSAARLGARGFDVPVRLVDSGTASFGVGCCVWAAGDALAAGASLDAAASVAESLAPSIGNVFTIGAVDLVRGARRLTPAAPHASNLAAALSEPDSVPVLALQEGQVQVIDRVASVVEAVDVMAAAVSRAGACVNVGLGLADATARPLADALQCTLRRHTNVAEVVRYRIGPSVGAHAGPGAVGCFMFPASP